MEAIHTHYLMREVLAQFHTTAKGHCARVDFLGLAEAISICQVIRHDTASSPTLAAYVLTSDNSLAKADETFITTDRAIELRNRKQKRLCLFIPGDLVDAAYSSLANSFALIDGRTLHARALKRIVDERLPSDAKKIIHSVLTHLRWVPGISDERKLDFVVAAARRAEQGELALTGLELWRVGLIADAAPDFAERLDKNRRMMLSLVKPSKVDATIRQRVQSLKVKSTTAHALERCLQGLSVQDVRVWSRTLEAAHLTFDQWEFDEPIPSNITSVSINPFTNAKGEVLRSSGLIRPDGINGSLLALYGPKEKLVVGWKCTPEKPNNIGGWRVSIVRAGDNAHGDETVELPEKDIPPGRRSLTISLDLALDAPPDFPVCFKVVPLDLAGNGIQRDVDSDKIQSNVDTDEIIQATSKEFFLVESVSDQPAAPKRENRRTVPTLAFGHLDVAVESRETVLEETDPQWTSKDLDYFSIRINDHPILNVGLSQTLLHLEKRVLDTTYQGGSFVLHMDEVRSVTSDDIAAYPISPEPRDSWRAFWRQRELFFKKLKQSEVRSVIEAADWTADLAGTALRYAQSYRDLLDDLLKAPAEHAEVLQALSVDTLYITLASHHNQTEEALVILPTHPLRVAWFANYTQLLHTWEENLLDLPQRKRKENLDLQALRLLVPTNAPAFAYHAASATPFIFFQNLLFFHGIALPAQAPDPHRRYSDIATILDAGIDQIGAGDVQPSRLADHLSTFQELHPYADTLVTTLINPDRGNFFAEALKTLLPSQTGRSTDEEQLAPLPMFQIISYTEDTHTETLQAVEQALQQPLELRYGRSTDHFHPGLTTISRQIGQLEHSEPPEAHIAVVTDFTRPTVVATPATNSTNNELSSFSFYGLINRFIPQFTAGAEGLFWYHKIIIDGLRKPEPHPAGPRYSETLIELHTAHLLAGGRLLGNGQISQVDNPPQPMLKVQLSAQRRDLLERLHARTNWVITLDRFFTLDYYDSPNEPGLGDVARKYVLDYAPEFTEGLGHRMMVTTTWHEEISSLLSQAMDELGFAGAEQSVSRLLHHLKTISGRLALQALESSTNATNAVVLGVVTAWLQQQGRLRQAVLIPADVYPRLFSLERTSASERDPRHCDLALITLKRNIVEAAFIQVKWRRGNAPLEGLARDMTLQMKASEQAMRNRFFNELQIDGTLQRSYLATVLHFYFERSRRYHLFDPEAETTFLEHIARLERTRLDFKASYEGYILSLDGAPHKPLVVDGAKITILTEKSFEEQTTAFPLAQHASSIEYLPTLQPKHLFETIEDEDTPVVIDYTDTVTEATLQLPAIPRQKDSKPGAQIEIAFGDAKAAGTPVCWHPGVTGSPHLFILGIPGQGKSWTVTRILAALGQQQVPALVLDFHGQFADPQESFVRTVHPTVLDAARGLPFSPFECSRDDEMSDWKANTLALAEIFAYVAGLGDIQRDIVFTAIRDAYLDRGFDNSAINSSDLEYPTLAEVLKQIEQKEQRRHAGNVTARCRPLLEMDLFRPAEHAPDLLSLVRNGLVIDLHHLWAETLQMAAGAFVLRKVYKDMFHWGYADRIRLAIVLDEAHRLAKDVTLPKIMKEGRKFGVAVLVASQGLNDFHPDIVNNVGTKVIFRMNYPESKRAAGFIRARAGTDLASQIEQLAVGEAYIQTPEMSHGAIVKMYS